MRVISSSRAVKKFSNIVLESWIFGRIKIETKLSRIPMQEAAETNSSSAIASVEVVRRRAGTELSVHCL